MRISYPAQANRLEAAIGKENFPATKNSIYNICVQDIPESYKFKCVPPLKIKITRFKNSSSQVWQLRFHSKGQYLYAIFLLSIERGMI